MFGLTVLGAIHTAISLVAVGAALVAFAHAGAISLKTGVGKLYAATTVLTCLTALGIYRHGGFGPPHALALITLLVLALGAAAELKRSFGRASPYVATLSYSATFLFHMIPAVTETTTRLPLGHPLLADAAAPELKTAIGVLLALFLLGAGWQALRLRASATQ